MKSIQQATAEAIEQAYKQGKVNVSDTWSVINGDNALALFRAILKEVPIHVKVDLCSDYPTTATQIEYVQTQVERSWNDLCILQAELGQPAHEYNQRKDSTENAR